MFQFPNFDWLLEEWPELNIGIASAVVLTALLASIFYIFLQYRRPKNAALRHRRAILHHECFNGFSTPPHINCQNGKCLCCPKAKQMALGTIVAMSGDLPSKRIIFLRRPVTTSKNNQMFQFLNFDWLFVERLPIPFVIAFVIIFMAMLAAALHLLLLYRRVRRIRKGWRNPAALRRQAIKNANRFNVVPSPPDFNFLRGEYFYCPKEKELAFGKVVAVGKDPKMNRKLLLIEPVTTSKKNRDAPPMAGSGATTSSLTTF
ncbi:hypothetical protein T06_10475 [Trichinella sp. T6]|nr:hypothetical protein T06_10475 [Trichinella sp. T6]